MSARRYTAIATKVHSELLKQLDHAGSGLVQAVFQLQSPDNPGARLSPSEAAALADKALKRVAARLNGKAVRTNVLRNLGTLIVEASPQFLRSLMEQPEIRSASPNKLPESPLIPPKGKRPV
jgi:hypothetical protein